MLRTMYLAGSLCDNSLYIQCHDDFRSFLSLTIGTDVFLHMEVLDVLDDIILPGRLAKSNSACMVEIQSLLLYHHLPGIASRANTITRETRLEDQNALLVGLQ